MKIDGLKAIREQADEGSEIVIYDLAGDAYKASDGSDATFTLLGSESKKYRDAKLAHQRRLIKRARAGGREMTPEELDLATLKQAASAFLGWHGWEDDRGADHPCEEKYILKVISYGHILEQAQAGIQGHAVFFTNDSGD